MEPIELSLFASRLQAICEEMGTALRRTAFSPNIRDRLDFSCAVFDTKGRLSAQAAHIPVHLGSMAFAMSGIVEGLRPAPGDMVILNDPYLGGTHLPDVTLIAPLFHRTEHCGFVVNRAHHADIGCATPGGMPIATRLEDEGLVIAPQRLMAEGRLLTEVMEWLIRTTRDPSTARGDLAAQIGANRCGLERLGALVAGLGPERYRASLADLNDYGEGMARTALARIPAGCYHFTDWLDDDGQGQEDIPIRLALTVSGEGVHADFAGTASQVPGNLNCPLSVAAAAVYYVFYCLVPRETPACAGAFRPITLSAPQGCLLNARRPAAVAAGNVETSTRIVDVVLGALAQALPEAIPAASHGSMNNVAMGTDTWDYYETVGGGMGAHAHGPGLDGVHTHMTNTRNTPIEVLETTYPLRVTGYALRERSGGLGRHAGGRGLVREFQFLTPTSVTVLGERRRHAPWGLAGGGDGQRAVTLLNGTPLPGKVHLTAAPGDRLTLQTAGGGGWGGPLSRRLFRSPKRLHCAPHSRITIEREVRYGCNGTDQTDDRGQPRRHLHEGDAGLPPVRVFHARHRGPQGLSRGFRACGYPGRAGGAAEPAALFQLANLPPGLHRRGIGRWLRYRHGPLPERRVAEDDRRRSEPRGRLRQQIEA